MDKSVANIQFAGKSKSLTNQCCFYHYTTFHFISQYVLFHNQLMSTKMQICSLCNFYAVYEEIPEELLDETDVDSYFYHNILDISQSHHRIVRVRKVKTKFFLHSKCFIFVIQSYSSGLFSRKKSAFLKRKLILYSTAWVNFSKLLIKPTKYGTFDHPNLNLRLDLQKQKTNCSVIVTSI